MADYTIESETSANDESSTFARVRITFASGEVIEERFASYFDDMSEPAIVQAASFVAAFEESRHIPLEDRLGPFGLEWQREQEERRG